jgi:hypothetical protein
MGETPLWLSVTTASVAVGSLIYSVTKSLLVDRSLEKLKASNAESLEALRERINERGAESSARRSYEYEARKRLYKECEPLLFQFHQAAEGACSRVYSIARAGRAGGLDKGSSWLSPDEYYLRSTVYRLMAPIAMFRLIESALTIVDIRLDRYLADQFKLGKIAFSMFTKDFNLAGSGDKLRYEPQVKGAREALRAPAVYADQALLWGTLETAVQHLIVYSEGKGRLLYYGEFDSTMKQSASERKIFEQVFDLFVDFHPESKPVLWRILVANLIVYRTLLDRPSASSNEDSGMPDVRWFEPLPDDLDWRARSVEGVNLVLVGSIEAAKAFLTHALREQTDQSD